MIEKVEDTLNGGYGGLYGEVVTCDTYKLLELNFIPDLIFDIGANVGIFARYARTLFPDAEIIAVEPDSDNLQNLRKFTFDSKLRIIEAALGVGPVYRVAGAVNGAHEAYFTKGLGYPKSDPPHPHYQPSLATAVTLAQIVKSTGWQGRKTFLKLDCEGGENSIWQDEESMMFLRMMDAVSIELHYHAAYGGPVHEEVKRVTDNALASLAATHQCEKDGCHFHARKCTTLKT